MSLLLKKLFKAQYFRTFASSSSTIGYEDLLLNFQFDDSEVLHEDNTLQILNYKQSGTLDDIRELKFNNSLNMTQSLHQLNQPQRLFVPYQFDIMASTVLLQSQPISKILLIGLGAGTLALHIKHLYPNCLIDVIEIKPELIDISDKYFNLQSNKTLNNIYINNAINEIKNLSYNTYDIIIQDAHNEQPEELLSYEIQNQLKYLLKDDHGIYIQNLYCRNQSQKSVIVNTQILYDQTFLISTQPEYIEQEDEDQQDAIDKKKSIMNPNVIVTGIKGVESKRSIEYYNDSDKIFDHGLDLLDLGYMTDSVLANVPNLSNFTKIDLQSQPFHLKK